MSEWLNSVREFMRRIFIGRSSKTPIYDSMLKQLEDIQKCLKEVKEELTFDKEVLLKELKKRDIIINAMIEELPDMLWFKDVNGKYVYANRAIREGLLFDDKPIGKTDVELALQAKKQFGDENHTFGEVCGNSDKDTLEGGHTGKRYVESGKIKGEMKHLEVHKSVLVMEGEVIGVVGSGRDITDYREELLAKGDCVDVFKKNEFTNKEE
jgi:PAS domain-containing protein